MAKYLDKTIGHIDISGNGDLDGLVTSFSRASFQARNISRCVEVYRQMLQDEEAVIFFGLAGAMVPAGMRKIIADLIRHHLIDVLVSTGANLYHDFFEAIGFHHYVGSPSVSDYDLRQARIDRIYDTFASDAEFDRAEEKIAEIASGLEQRVYSSREFLECLVSGIEDDESILCTAAKEKVPVFCPALCDSGIGMALTHYYGRPGNDHKLTIDQIRDNFEIVQIKRDAARTGAFYVGGGVPKNYIQQLAPMLDGFGLRREGHKYFVQLTTENPKYGGLSGCTAAEAESWGKVTNDRMAATAYVDATIGLPLVAGTVLGDCSGQSARAKRVFCWKGDNLEEIRIG
jgi:deoxyhypusine synthase